MMPTDSSSVRDRGLGLVSRANRWLVAGAVGLSAVLSFAAANAFHGHQRVHSIPAQASRAQRRPPSGAKSLQQPAQAPAPGASGGGGVVSGGS